LRRGSWDRLVGDRLGDFFVSIGVSRAVTLIAVICLALSLTITIAVTAAFGIRAAPYWIAALVTATLAPLLTGTLHSLLLVRLLYDLHVSRARVQKLALRDELTGLVNRHHFRERAAAALEAGGTGDLPMSVILLDVDHFKDVNDTFGHAVGDLALKGIAAACAAIARPSDVLARYGGEEFALLLPMTDLRGAVLVAEQMRQAVAARPIDRGDGQYLHATVSVGITSREGSSGSLDTLLESADRALYHAKRTGRDRIVVWTGGKAAAPTG
jgi:diguanylate cyclase (GGDEF)-like protein